MGKAQEQWILTGTGKVHTVKRRKQKESRIQGKILFRNYYVVENSIFEVPTFSYKFELAKGSQRRHLQTILVTRASWNPGKRELTSKFISLHLHECRNMHAYKNTSHMHIPVCTHAQV